VNKPEPIVPEIRVLAVAGDPADIAVLVSVVALNGADLRILSPGAQGLVDEIHRYQPDVLIIDLKQPGSDGFQLCAALKSAPETSVVPVVLTGTLDGPEARRRATEAGCDDFFEKPVNRHMLAFRIRSLARLRRAWIRKTDPG
jgi:PleD family two-component response regulator